MASGVNHQQQHHAPHHLHPLQHQQPPSPRQQAAATNNHHHHQQQGHQQHHCKDCGVYFESAKSLEVHLHYHKENLLSKWVNNGSASANNQSPSGGSGGGNGGDGAVGQGGGGVGAPSTNGTGAPVSSPSSTSSPISSSSQSSQPAPSASGADSVVTNGCDPQQEGENGGTGDGSRGIDGNRGHSTSPRQQPLPPPPPPPPSSSAPSSFLPPTPGSYSNAQSPYLQSPPPQPDSRFSPGFGGAQGGGGNPGEVPPSSSPFQGFSMLPPNEVRSPSSNASSNPNAGFYPPDGGYAQSEFTGPVRGNGAGGMGTTPPPSSPASGGGGHYPQHHHSGGHQRYHPYNGGGGPPGGGGLYPPSQSPQNQQPPPSSIPLFAQSPNSASSGQQQCDKCGFVCENSTSLLEHINSAHPQQGGPQPQHARGNGSSRRPHSSPVSSSSTSVVPNPTSSAPGGGYMDGGSFYATAGVNKDGNEAAEILDLDSHKVHVYQPPDSQTGSSGPGMSWGHQQHHLLNQHPHHLDQKLFHPQHHHQQMLGGMLGVGPSPVSSTDYLNSDGLVPLSSHPHHPHSLGYPPLHPPHLGLAPTYQDLGGGGHIPMHSSTGPVSPAPPHVPEISSLHHHHSAMTPLHQQPPHMQMGPQGATSPSAALPPPPVAPAQQAPPQPAQQPQQQPSTTTNSSANQSWKSNEARRPKTYNCSACNKWFTSSGHLKRHYNTTLHKNAMKQAGGADPPPAGKATGRGGDSSNNSGSAGSGSIGSPTTSSTTPTPRGGGTGGMLGGGDSSSATPSPAASLGGEESSRSSACEDSNGHHHPYGGPAGPLPPSGAVPPPPGPLPPPPPPPLVQTTGMHPPPMSASPSSPSQGQMGAGGMMYAANPGGGRPPQQHLQQLHHHHHQQPPSMMPATSPLHPLQQQQHHHLQQMHPAAHMMHQQQQMQHHHQQMQHMQSMQGMQQQQSPQIRSPFPNGLPPHVSTTTTTSTSNTASTSGSIGGPKAASSDELITDDIPPSASPFPIEIRRSYPPQVPSPLQNPSQNNGFLLSPTQSHHLTPLPSFSQFHQYGNGPLSPTSAVLPPFGSVHQNPTFLYQHHGFAQQSLVPHHAGVTENVGGLSSMSNLLAMEQHHPYGGSLHIQQQGMHMTNNGTHLSYDEGVATYINNNSLTNGNDDDDMDQGDGLVIEENGDTMETEDNSQSLPGSSLDKEEIKVVIKKEPDVNPPNSNGISTTTKQKTKTTSSATTNTNGELHKCIDCDKVFNKACYLTQHNKTFHSGDKPFKCNLCGKRFPAEYLYQEHLTKHAGEKPYKCEICPKQFNHKTDLRRHMCLHTGEKPYSCEVCGKGFIRKDHMLKHNETHRRKIQQQAPPQQQVMHSGVGGRLGNGSHSLRRESRELEARGGRRKMAGVGNHFHRWREGGRGSRSEWFPKQ
ncbi:hypothetical protein J437_LFUL005204 [Ladona fulva]|uniref:C2H2-type domain-containing protein n=1 Tax=Ladona fulva TaxID=123851 RepID=A0A8K0JYP1_LADFU|nr:hypothetical protein J437_LFUL005204 [Ladona fulva]